MRTKKFASRIELLNDTITYYWGIPERRCSNGDGCKYYSVNKQTEGCAIGRLITKKLCRELDAMAKSEVAGSGVNNINVFNKLPKWMRDLGQDFLSDVQNLHDYEHLKYKWRNTVIGEMKQYVNVDEIVFPIS